MGSDISCRLGDTKHTTSGSNSQEQTSGWFLKTEWHIINNLFWKIQLSDSNLHSHPYANLMESQMTVIEYDSPTQPFSLFLEKDYVCLLMNLVLNLVDLFHVLIHSDLTVQPRLRIIVVYLCSVHIWCLRVYSSKIILLPYAFWEEESVLNVASFSSCTSYTRSKQYKTM